MSRGILFLMVLFSLPALACNFIIVPDTDATATTISAEIFATMTATVPTTTFTLPPTDTALPTSTATITPTDTPLPSPNITNTPEPTFTPEPTKPTIPTFGPVAFYTDEDYIQEYFDNPSKEFPSGTIAVNACFDYWALTPSTRFSRYWYVNGREWGSFAENWKHGEQGSLCLRAHYTGTGTTGLESGNWKLKLFIGSELAQEEEFHIGR